MPLLSTWLRVFLIVILALNGAGKGYASVGMEREAGLVRSHGVDVDNRNVVSASPCPDHHDAMATGSETPEHRSRGDEPGPDDQHGAPDCCDPSHCDCPCMHACVALPVLTVKIPGPSGKDVGVRRLSLEHPAPALPHLIRPPIG